MCRAFPEPCEPVTLPLKSRAAPCATICRFSSLCQNATFVGANMTLSDLESGNFEEADLTNAVLSGAFVNNAQFKNTVITNTDW